MSARDLEDAHASRPELALWLGHDEHGARVWAEVDKDHFEIGNGDHVDLRLGDASLSPRHCRISWDEGGYRVRDMHSRHGTFVDEEVVPLSHPLADGDRLRLGDVVLHVSLRAREAPAGESAAGPDATAFVAPADVDELAADALPRPEAHDDQAPPVACFVLSFRDVAGEAVEARLVRGQTLVLGRHADCDVPLGDKGVSSRHCTLAWAAGTDGRSPGARPILRDLGSTNGTFVDGERVSRVEVGDGAVVRLGRFPVRLSALVDDAPHAALADAHEDAPVATDAARFHVVFVDRHDALATVTLSEREPRLGIGSTSEIHVPERFGLPDEAATLAWNESSLTITPHAGSELRVDGARRGHAELTGGERLELAAPGLAPFRLRVVRGAPDRSPAAPPRGPSVEASVGAWSERLDALDPDLELLFVDPQAHAGRSELCVWADGVVQADTKTGDAATSSYGKAHEDTLRALAEALVRAGFPDAHPGGDDGRSGVDPELHASCGRLRADVVIGRRLAVRSAAWAEVRDLMRALLAELVPPPQSP